MSIDEPGVGRYNDDPSDYEDQLQPEDTLIQDGVEDVLDRGYSPPDSARGSYAHGVTPAEESTEETIEDRIKQEMPDPNSAYGAPDNESGLDEDPLGGDDPDAIDADEDWLGDAEIGDRRAGRLVAPDAGLGEDIDKDEVAEDVGIDGAGASAEEAAMHIIEPGDRGFDGNL